MDHLIIQTGRELRRFTGGAGENFHEPDEQGIRFLSSVGTKLDNAFGRRISEEALEGNFQEVVLLFDRIREDNVRIVQSFNLATLIALARIGAESLLYGDGK